MRVSLQKVSKNQLLLIDDIEIKKFQLIPNGTLLESDIRIDRSLNFHRKFRGFLDVIWETIHENEWHKYPTFESFYNAIRIACGLYRIEVMNDNSKRIFFESTGFDTMDEIEYKTLVANTIYLITTNYFNVGNPRVLIETLTRYNYY